MPKFKSYEQKFRKEWFNDTSLKDRIMEIFGNSNKSCCKYCNCKLKAKYQNLKNHIKSNKHAAALSARNITPLTNIFKCTKNNASSKIEGSITMFLSCHCAIANGDHFVDMLKNNISNNKV